MKTELLGQEKNVVRVKVEFEAAELSKGLAEALGEISRSTNIPRFHKGHAPRRVIEMRVGRQTLYNEALEKILSGALQQVIEDYDLETISDPSIHIDDIHEGEKKWQKRWDEENIYKVTEDKSREKYYVLEMFPLL